MPEARTFPGKAPPALTTLLPAPDQSRPSSDAATRLTTRCLETQLPCTCRRQETATHARAKEDQQVTQEAERVQTSPPLLHRLSSYPAAQLGHLLRDQDRRTVPGNHCASVPLTSAAWGRVTRQLRWEWMPTVDLASGPDKYNVSLLYQQKATCPKPALPPN